MGVTPSHETSVQQSRSLKRKITFKLDAIKKVTRIWSMTMHVAGMNKKQSRPFKTQEWSGQCASQLIPVHYRRTVLLNEGL